MEIILILWVVCGIAGGLLAQSKGRSFGEGLFLGIMLGFIGLIIEACLSSKTEIADWVVYTIYWLVNWIVKGVKIAAVVLILGSLLTLLLLNAPWLIPFLLLLLVGICLLPRILRERSQRIEKIQKMQEKQKISNTLARLKKRAERGDVDAQYYLGECYIAGMLAGIGIEKDIDQGQRWLHKAAEQGDKRAERLLLTTGSSTESSMGGFWYQRPR